jgi:hypothetical protein
MNITDGTFSAELPSIIEQALPKEQLLHPSPTNKKCPPPDPSDETPSPKKTLKNKDKLHGIPDINAVFNPAWHLLKGETCVDHFVCKIDHRKFPPCNICSITTSKEHAILYVNIYLLTNHMASLAPRIRNPH